MRQPARARHNACHYGALHGLDVINAGAWSASPSAAARRSSDDMDKRRRGNIRLAQRTGTHRVKEHGHRRSSARQTPAKQVVPGAADAREIIDRGRYRQYSSAIMAPAIETESLHLRT